MRWLASRRRLVAIILIYTIVLCVLLGMVSHKPSINSATLNELENIHGIGEVLATRVSLYLSVNPKSEIDDLIQVDGIGKERLELIKDVFK